MRAEVAASRNIAHLRAYRLGCREPFRCSDEARGQPYDSEPLSCVIASCQRRERAPFVSRGFSIPLLTPFPHPFRLFS